MTSFLSHPQLANCRRLFLRDYEVWINIGVHDFEKKGEQRVLINVDLYIPLAMSTPKADELDEVVDYDFIRRTIAGRVQQGHIHLQETLCDDVLALMLAHPRVRAVRFLLTSPAITGTTLLVDGGQHLQAQSRDVMFLSREPNPAP